MRNYTHLSLPERELIYLYLNQGKSKRQIGRLLNRHHRTISREIKRNQKGGEATSELVNYRPSTAQSLATARRQLAKVGVRKLDDPALRQYVIRQLGRSWSPQQISGRLKLKAPQSAVSYETIYQFIYAKDNRRLRLYELLRKRHRSRYQKSGRKGHRLKIPARILIDHRPQAANLRLEVGHWETDNMEGNRATKACVSTSVDRKSLLTKLAKLDSKEAKEKTAGLIRNFGNWPTHLIKTMTYDNGKENYYHQQIAVKLNCHNYFCHAYHSWEKGTVENTIGLVREYLPKGTDLSQVTQGELSWIADQLNHRPRKKLGYYTPSEIFEKETGWGS